MFLISNQIRQLEAPPQTLLVRCLIFSIPKRLNEKRKGLS